MQHLLLASMVTRHSLRTAKRDKNLAWTVVYTTHGEMMVNFGDRRW
jgi:hypothetical protein